MFRSGEARCNTHPRIVKHCTLQCAAPGSGLDRILECAFLRKRSEPKAQLRKRKGHQIASGAVAGIIAEIAPAHAVPHAVHAGAEARRPSFRRQLSHVRAPWHRLAFEPTCEATSVALEIGAPELPEPLPMPKARPACAGSMVAAAAMAAIRMVRYTELLLCFFLESRVIAPDRQEHCDRCHKSDDRRR